MGIQLDVCAILVESYPEGVITIDIHGRTPLHILCANLSFSMPNNMKLLIETDPFVVNIANNKGLLPLHLLGYQAAKIPANDLQKSSHDSKHLPELLHQCETSGNN